MTIFRRTLVIFPVLLALMAARLAFANVVSTCPAELKWEVAHNAANTDDIAYSVAVDKDGNVIVAGFQDGDSLGDKMVNKYSPSGALLWSKVFPGPTEEKFYGVAVDANGYISAAGLYNSLGYVTRLAPDSTWQWSYAASGFMGKTFGAAFDGKGDLLVAGISDETPGKFKLSKMSPTGTVVWSRTYGSPAGAEAFAVAVDSHDNVISVGNEHVGAPLGEDWDWVVRKYTSSGTLMWSRSHQGREPFYRDEPLDVAVDAQDNVIVVGVEIIARRADWVIRKYDQAGTLLWSRAYDGAAGLDDVALGVAIDSCGNIVVAGYEDGDTTMDDKYGELLKDRPYVAGTGLVLIYSPSGELLGNVKYDNPASDREAYTDVAVDRNGNIVLAGYEKRDDLGQGFNWIVHKLSAFGGNCSCAPTPPPPPPDEFTGRVKIVGGVRGYINPKKGEKSTIMVRPDRAGAIKVRIYTEQGRLIWETTVQAAGGRTEVIHWFATDGTGAQVPPGVYPIFIEAPDIRYRDKLIVIR